MARIAGVNIPSKKRLPIALRYIYGIGPFFAQKICDTLGIPSEKRVFQLSDDEILKISTTIDKEYLVEGALRAKIDENIRSLHRIGCYRGIRHYQGKTVRGQRTHTNARTARRVRASSRPLGKG